MFKPTGTPQPQKRYKDAHGALVTVESVSHNRVTFYRDGYPLYVKQEDFSDITATAKHQFRDKYAREGYQLQKVLQLRPTSTRTMAGDTIKVFST